MKTILYYLIIILSISSCKGQKIIIESKSKDIIVFEFEENNVKHISVKKKYLNTKGIIPLNTTIYNKNKIIIITQRWQGYGTGHFDKIYSFAKEKDTMNIHCLYGQERNNYFKDIQFQKGDYELNFKIPEIKDKVLGNTISATKEMKNTLFKNNYTLTLKKNSKEVKDLPFKDLFFSKISLKEEGVIWKKLDKKK